MAAQREIAGQKGEACRGVSCGKAAARPAVGQAQRPVRDMARHAAELGQVPGAAGRAGVLEQRDQGQRQQDARHQLHAPPMRQQAQRAHGPPDAQRQAQHHQPGQAACAFVGDVHEEPVRTQRKAIGVAEPAGHGQVQGAGIPGQDHGQGRQGPQQGAFEGGALRGGGGEISGVGCRHGRQHEKRGLNPS